jgi:pyruvate dehydrogenase E1 component beta subunit
VYIEHKQLMGLVGDVPEGEYVVPFGKADIKREGADITIVAWSWMLQKALAAAEELAKKGINVEVLDPRTLVPLDKDAILKSVAKTGKLLIVHEEVKTSGFGGEIAAIVCEEGFDYLDAPIKRVTAPDTPIPFATILENAFIPSVEKIIKAVEGFF